MPDHIDHNEFFRNNNEEYYCDQMQERRSTEIKVRIRPNQSTIPNELTTELWNDHNMDLFQSNSHRNIVIVSGIPPDNVFGEHELMEVFKRYAPRAKVVRESFQRGG